MSSSFWDYIQKWQREEEMHQVSSGITRILRKPEKICFSIYKKWWEFFVSDFNNILLYWTENTSVYISPVQPIQILPYLARSIENEAINYI